MNYTVNGKRYEANEGYVFQSKKTGIIAKVLRLPKPEMIENYEIIIEEQEATEDVNSTDI